MKKVQLLGLMLLAAFFAFQGVSHAEDSAVKAAGTAAIGSTDTAAVNVEAKVDEKKAEDILADAKEDEAVPAVAAEAVVKS